MCYHVSRPSVRALKNEHSDGFRLITEDSERNTGYDHPDLPATITFAAEPAPLEWGLIPSWARDLEHARQLQNSGLNARGDTMFDKPMFRESAAQRRCIIWLDGFYEWQHVGRKKIPYFIHLPGNALMPVGGLWSEWRNPVDGELFRTCAIITTGANELMAEIHNSKLRMPFVLSPGAQEPWLDLTQSRRDVEALCRPFEDGVLEAEVVEEPKAKPEQQLNLF